MTSTRNGTLRESSIQHELPCESYLLSVLIIPSFIFAQEQVLVLKNISIVDVKQGQIHEDQVVVIKGNKIVAVNKKVRISKYAIRLMRPGSI